MICRPFIQSWKKISRLAAGWGRFNRCCRPASPYLGKNIAATLSSEEVLEQAAQIGADVRFAFIRAGKL